MPLSPNSLARAAAVTNSRCRSVAADGSLKTILALCTRKVTSGATSRAVAPMNMKPQAELHAASRYDSRAASSFWPLLIARHAASICAA